MDKSRVRLVVAVAALGVAVVCGSTRFGGRGHGGSPLSIPAVHAATIEDTTPPNPKDVHANEAGMVPVLMYHNIGGTKLYGMQYPLAMFREDLEWLYKHDYRPISLTDFVQGKIECPAGKSPVILTFDDGDRSQLNYLADGKIDPICAVAIMDQFHATHPDWLTRGTYFIIAGSSRLPAPFYQRKYVKAKLDYLVKEGYDIGNHTVHHPRMNHLGTAASTEEIAGCVKSIRRYLPGYHVNTLALPYGLFPKDSRVLVSGMAGGQSYTDVCAMAAGWQPAVPPIDKGFHRYSLDRIMTGTKVFQSRWWLNYLEEHKSRKFVSDGDPDTFSTSDSQVHRVDRYRLKGLGYHLTVYENRPKPSKIVSKPLTLAKTAGYTKRHN